MEHDGVFLLSKVYKVAAKESELHLFHLFHSDFLSYQDWRRSENHKLMLQCLSVI